MGKPRHVFSRAQLRDFVWGRGAHIEERTVDVHMADCARRLAPRVIPIQSERRGARAIF